MRCLIPVLAGAVLFSQALASRLDVDDGRTQLLRNIWMKPIESDLGNVRDVA